MRELKTANDNVMTITDPLDGSEVQFFYRTPETPDRVKYMVNRYRRSGQVMVDCTRSAAIAAATDVLTGIRPGDFCFAGQPLSSTPGEAGYREDWKELLVAVAGDLLFLLGFDLFVGRISAADIEHIPLRGEHEETAPPAELESVIDPLG